MNQGSLTTPPESGLAKELFDLVVDLAADNERSGINSDERRRRVCRLFALATSVQVLEAGGSVYNATTGETNQAARV